VNSWDPRTLISRAGSSKVVTSGNEGKKKKKKKAKAKDTRINPLELECCVVHRAHIKDRHNKRNIDSISV
jgi:hypothetical protein